jgi:hypothetical protein
MHFALVLSAPAIKTSLKLSNPVVKRSDLRGNQLIRSAAKTAYEQEGNSMNKNKKQILVITSALPNGLADWSEQTKSFDLIVVNEHEAAIELCQQRSFDLAVVDHTDSSIDHKKLAAVLPVFHQEMAIVSYHGEPAVEVEDTIIAYFDQQKLERFRRLLILDPTEKNETGNLPPFSDN